MEKKSEVKKYMLLIVFAVLVFTVAQNIDKVLGGFGYVISLFSSFIIGLCLAFVLNCPMRGFENKVFKNDKAKLYKYKRPISVFVTLIFVSGIIAILIFLVVPQVVETARSIKESFPEYWTSFMAWLDELAIKYNISTDILDKINFDWNELGSNVANFFEKKGLINKTVSVTTGIFSGVFNAIMGIVFAVYILYHKETLGRQIDSVMKAFFPSKLREGVLHISDMSSDIFSRFVAGQVLEAIILGLLCFVGMAILKLPYPAMISVLIGFTALIPVFGAFIGTAIGAFLILIINPMQALWFVVYIIILQRVDGCFIYPKVVGKSVGLSSMWVMLAVMVGGSVGGALGLLIAVPISSILYSLLKEIVYQRLESK